MTNTQKTIITIECAGGSVSVAVACGEIITSQYIEMPYGHVQVIVPMIESVLHSSGVKRTDIDAIGVSTGPGFFTGMRVGLSTAQGLAIGLQKPLYGVSTLEAYAHQIKQSGTVYIIMETKRNDFYVQKFDATTAIDDVKVLTADEIRPLLNDTVTIAGSGVQRLKTEIDSAIYTKSIASHFTFPTADSVAKCIYHKMQMGQVLPTSPQYFRMPEVHKAKSK